MSVIDDPRVDIEHGVTLAVSLFFLWYEVFKTILDHQRAKQFYRLHRTFEQTISFIEKVATTKIHEDIANLIAELGIQLRELELERKEDHKIVKLHPFEVASLANLIKAVSSATWQRLCLISEKTSVSKLKHLYLTL